MQSLNGSSAAPGVAPTRSLLSEFSSEKEPRSCAEHREVSTQLETESKSTKWTDEKHSLYLESMETSFVNQLYNSLDVLGWRPNEEDSSEHKACIQKYNGKGTPSPSGQFKVFRDGSWARMNFRRETPRPKKVEGSGTILSNPWIRHYKSSYRQGTRKSPAFQEGAPLATNSHLQMDCQDSVGSHAEVTDQNFVDEVSEEVNSSRTRSNKCRKLSTAAGSGNDQVVPFEKLSLVRDVAEGHGSSKE